MKYTFNTQIRIFHLLTVMQDACGKVEIWLKINDWKTLSGVFRFSPWVSFEDSSGSLHQSRAPIFSDFHFMEYMNIIISQRVFQTSINWTLCGHSWLTVAIYLFDQLVQGEGSLVKHVSVKKKKDRMKETLIKFTPWHVSMATKSPQQGQNA